MKEIDVNFLYDASKRIFVTKYAWINRLLAKPKGSSWLFGDPFSSQIIHMMACVDVVHFYIGEDFKPFIAAILAVLAHVIDVVGRFMVKTVVHKMQLCFVTNTVSEPMQKFHNFCNKKHWPKVTYKVTIDLLPAHDRRYTSLAEIDASNSVFIVTGAERSRTKDIVNSASSPCFAKIK
ncbi:ribonuclease 3-like protein 2 [Artemisia annua]|uniref:Ribonuclease 3-like protein 2 n=1 Tax=Artemisia annua TaxID=35608 RepID=A0A2U1MNZ1_ARTAN|nr:ribonuclease 3-like protein 2 [Artemisia annua]